MDHTRLRAGAAGFAVSVVVPTFEREAPLRRTLAALCAQRLDGAAAEIVVVDNGSRDGSRERLEELAPELGLPTRILHEPTPGVAAARNAGVAAARADLVLFVNDDVRPAHDRVVAGHLAAHVAGDPLLGVLGPVAWAPELRVTPVMSWLDRTGKMHDYRGIAAGDWVGGFFANNLSVRRATLERVGGFDVRFGGYGWQEYELALRLRAIGFRLELDETLLGHHDHPHDLRESLRRMEKVGRSAALLHALHPEAPMADTPRPQGAKAALARAAAPLAGRARLPRRLPRPVEDATLRALHYAMLARGYERGAHA